MECVFEQLLVATLDTTWLFYFYKNGWFLRGKAQGEVDASPRNRIFRPHVIGIEGVPPKLAQNSQDDPLEIACSLG
jgi:hypothetical protein